MCVYMYINVYMSVYVCIHINVYMCIYVYMYKCICIYVYIQHFCKMSFFVIAKCVKLCHHIISYPLDYMFGKGTLFLKLFWA